MFVLQSLELVDGVIIFNLNKIDLILYCRLGLIERMVSEAEKFKAEDDANRNRIESKNGLENYCYSLRSSISYEEVRRLLSLRSLHPLLLRRHSLLYAHPRNHSCLSRSHQLLHLFQCYS